MYWRPKTAITAALLGLLMLLPATATASETVASRSALELSVTATLAGNEVIVQITHVDKTDNRPAMAQVIPVRWSNCKQQSKPVQGMDLSVPQQFTLPCPGGADMSGNFAPLTASVRCACGRAMAVNHTVYGPFPRIGS